MKKFEKTEVAERIEENICTHTFVLKGMKIKVCILSKKGKLKAAIINHFNSWKSSSLSNSDRRELYAIYQIEGQGRKVTEFDRYILVIESIDIGIGTDKDIENTECLEEFYMELAKK